MELSTIFFILAGLFLLFGAYKLATSFTKETRNTSGQIQNLQSNKFSTEMNRFAAKKEMAPSVNRTGLASQLSSEASAIAALGKAQTEAIAAEDEVTNAPARLAELRQQEEAAHQNLLTLTDEATNRQISPSALDQQKLKEHEINETLRLDAGKAYIEVDKYRQIKDVDFDMYRQEREIDVKGAIIASVAPIYAVELLTQQLQKALLDRENWEAMPDSTSKSKMLSRLNKNIKLLNEAIDAKGQELIQGINRTELGSVCED
jgi:hypothetical protein